VVRWERRSLLCLVTGIPNRREQKGARRRSVRPAVQDRPGPCARSSRRTRAEPPYWAATRAEGVVVCVASELGDLCAAERVVGTVG